MRIGLNLLHAMPEIGGGWQHIQGTVRAAALLAGEHSLVAFATGVSEALIPPGAPIEVVRVGLDARRRVARVAYENSVLYAEGRRQRLDCMHWFANALGVLNAAPGVVTVHDLLAFHHPERFPLHKRVYVQRMLRRTARRAPVLAPVSESTAADLERTLGVPRDRMVVVPASLAPWWRPAPPERVAALRARLGLPERFWLYVAHQYPHKNHARLLDAFARVRRGRPDGWDLVLRADTQGGEDVVGREVARLGLDARVHRLPRLSDEDMVTLYGAASSVVFPSLFEGAGIPLVEALACGCPVLASDIPPAREFLAEAGHFFDPTDPERIADAMLSFEADGAARARAASIGPAVAARSSDAATAKRLLACYGRAASTRAAAARA